MVRYLSFHNSSFASIYLFNVSGKVTVWNNPLLLFVCNWRRMMHFSALVRPPFQAECARPTYKAKKKPGPTKEGIVNQVNGGMCMKLLTLIRLQSSMIECSWASMWVGADVCVCVCVCLREKKTHKMTNFNTDGMQQRLWTLWVSVSTTGLHTTKYCNGAATLLCTASSWNILHPKFYWGLGIVRACWKVGNPTTKKLVNRKRRNFPVHFSTHSLLGPSGFLVSKFYWNEKNTY
jgi:hypothetical protein